MAVHDRLKPPTMETAQARAFFGLPLTLALVVLAAGFAYAMPRIQNVSAGTEDPSVVVLESPSATPTPEATELEELEVDKDEDEDADDAGADNHGKVVSTAAHCDIKGKAHGTLVRSIAKDKDATVADAEAACDAALAESVVQGSSAKPTGKPEKPAKSPKHVDADDTETEVEDAEEPAAHGKPDHAGKPAKP